MLYRLLSYTDREMYEPQVVSMRRIGPIGKKIRALGLPVRALGMRPSMPNPLSLLRLAWWLRQDPPDVVQTWMYQADLFGGLAARLAGKASIIWGIHSFTLDPGGETGIIEKRLKWWRLLACAWSSRSLPNSIVCCAEASRKLHAELGYAAEKMVVIPNGADLVTFKPDPEARRSVRRELGIRQEVPLVGLAARFHPQKDHRSFVRAAGLLRALMPEVEFLLCGDKIDWNNRELVGWIEEAKLRSCFHLLGPREDMPRITAALDVASSSSYSEAWPLAIGEAMACGVPCVVTDVGDSGLIVGDTGRVVSPKDPAALADAWRQVLALGSDARAQLGAAARRRVEEHFSVSTAVAKYEQLYKEEFGSRSDLVATVGNGFGWSRGSRRVEADEFVSAAEGLGRGVDSPVESSVDPPHDRGRTHEGIA